MLSLPPSKDSFDNGYGPMSEQRSVTSTLNFLRGLRKHADAVNTAMAGGLVAAVIALKYLPLSGPYCVMAAPGLILFMVLGAGATARWLTNKRKPSLRRPRRPSRVA